MRDVRKEIRDAILNMPDDIAEAFEAMKLAVMRHKISGWRDISQDDTICILGVLIQVAINQPQDSGEGRVKK